MSSPPAPSFCSHHGRTRSSDPIDFDLSLVEWVEHMWHEDESKSLANDTGSAVLQKIAQLKGHLHGSQRVLRAWSNNELPNRAPPLPTKFLLWLGKPSPWAELVLLCSCWLPSTLFCERRSF